MKQIQRGFTLIEMMVVLVIISILAGVVVMNFQGVDHDAALKAVKADFKTISTGLDRYKLDNKKYPTTDQGLAALIEKPAEGDRWKGPYLSTEPKDPWGNAYDYETKGSGFVIISYGVDGAAGGDDVDTDLFSTDQ